MYPLETSARFCFPINASNFQQQFLGEIHNRQYKAAPKCSHVFKLTP